MRRTSRSLHTVHKVHPLHTKCTLRPALLSFVAHPFLPFLFLSFFSMFGRAPPNVTFSGSCVPARRLGPCAPLLPVRGFFCPRAAPLSFRARSACTRFIVRPGVPMCLLSPHSGSLVLAVSWHPAPSRRASCQTSRFFSTLFSPSPSLSLFFSFLSFFSCLHAHLDRPGTATKPSALFPLETWRLFS